MIKLPEHASSRLIGVLAAASLVEMLSIDMYLPALPSMERQLGITANMTQSTISVFLVGTGIGQTLYGPLLERYGRRWPMLIGMLAFTLGSFVCALSTSLLPFLCGRLLQSIGAAGVIVTPRAIISDVYEGRSAARILAILGQIVMICPIVAPIAGAALVSRFDWRSVFWALTACGLIVFGASWRFLPETLPRSARVTIGPLQVMRGYGALFKNSKFTVYAFSLGCIFASMYVYLGGSSVVLITYFRISPLLFSLIFAAVALALILFGWLNIRLLKSHSVDHLLSAGLLAHAAFCIALTVLTMWLPLALWVYVAFLALAIGSAGGAWTNGTALAMGETAAAAGMGSAVLAVVQSAFGATAGPLLAFTGLDPRGLALAMAIFSSAALVARLLIPTRRTPPISASET